ncbi:hypothetical protein [Microlunatus sp. GCM10028923]|uniref:hypothetical protein n=1 Tax=Microlunatus sp. GCM10028923 TaxID=3273400 RepID=UPI0036198C7F
MQKLVEQIAAAARQTLTRRWAIGDWWFRADDAVTNSRFAFDIVDQRCVTVTAYLLPSRDAPFWQRMLVVGNSLYMPLGNEIAGADPQAPPARDQTWIKTPGTDFVSAAPPVTPLYWLLGATSAKPTGQHRALVTIGRDQSIEAAPAEHRQGVGETWEQIHAQAEDRNLTQLDCTVELAETETVRSIDIEVGPGRRIVTDYANVGEPVEIALPDQYESIPLTDLLTTLGAPTAEPPQAGNEPS